jgi:hypothetical protein
MYIHVIIFVLSVGLSSHVLGERSAAGVNLGACGGKTGSLSSDIVTNHHFFYHVVVLGSF